MLNACYWGAAEEVARLLQHGCPADVADYDGRTALFVACVNGREVGVWVCTVLLADAHAAGVYSMQFCHAKYDDCRHYMLAVVILGMTEFARFVRALLACVGVDFPAAKT